MLRLLKRWVQQLNVELRRASVLSFVVFALALDLAKSLLEHRIYGAMNEFIDTHAGRFLDYTKPLVSWFVRTPFTSLVAVVIVIMVHAYWKSRPVDVTQDHSQSSRFLLHGHSAGLADGTPDAGFNWKGADILDRIKTSKLARIGFVHYPPFVVAAADDLDQPTGLYVELIREFLASEGIKAEFEQVRFSSAVNCIINDQKDVILSIFETPRRKKFVDFSAFMHKVSVSGVVRRQENRIRSEADLRAYNFKFVVFREEIGHEILEDHFNIPDSRLNVLDGPNIGAMFDLVMERSADVAVADSLSCYHGLAARGAEGPKLKPVLRRSPLYLCPNGVMIGRDQTALGKWLDRGLKKLLSEPRFATMEASILEEYHGIITKM